MDKRTISQMITQNKKVQDIKIYSCIDLDAFFAQCESRRLGLEDDIPLVALQWVSCWGVNYEARKYGIKSGMNINEAKNLCPNLVVAHADTFKVNEDVPSRSPYERDISEKFKKHDKNTEKISLDLYRYEGDKIFSILRRNCPIVEKGSIDEAFLDITGQVNEIYKSGNYKKEWKGKFIGGEEFEPTEEEDIKLLIGTHIIEDIRIQVKKELNYTCSAGISFNKMLAKLGSGMNKPYGQAIITRKYAMEAISPLPIHKIRNFGRRIAEAFNDHGYEKVSEIQAMNLEQVLKIVGDEHTARYVYFRARGYDDEAVEEKDYTNRSILSNKSFYEVTNLLDLKEIIELLVNDLNARVIRFYKESSMVPHQISVHYHDKRTNQYRIKSQSVNMKVKPEQFQKILEEKSNEMVKQIADGLFPCHSLGISARNFEKSDMKQYGFDLVSYAKKKTQELESQKPESRLVKVPSFKEDDTPKSDQKQRDTASTTTPQDKTSKYLDEIYESQNQTFSQFAPKLSLGDQIKIRSGTLDSLPNTSMPGFMQQNANEYSNSIDKDSSLVQQIISSGKKAIQEDEAEHEEDPEEDEEKQECEKCNAMIAKSKMNAHIDFHIAEDLDRELNPNKKKYKRKAEQMEDEGPGTKATQPEIDNKKVKKGRNSTPSSTGKFGSQQLQASQSMRLDSFFKKKNG